MSEPGSIAMSCPYCGRKLCADRIEFVSTNVILRTKNLIPMNVIEGLTKRRLLAWCDPCGVSIIVEKVTTEPDDSEEAEE